MSTGRYVVPTPQPVSTFGILNLIFGGIFLLVGMVTLSSALTAPLFQKPSEAVAAAVDAQLAKEHDKVIAEIKALEEAAPTEGERQVYQQARAKLVEQGPHRSGTADMMSVGFRPELIRFYWLDALTSIPLNLALIVAGVGLIQLEEWGRKLALWVAGLKIARILLVQGYWIFGVVPPFAQALGASVQDMFVQVQAGGGGGAPPPIDFTMVYLVTYSVTGVFTIIMVCIFPIVSLVVLRRDGARAACLAAAQAAEADAKTAVEAGLA